MFHFHMTSSYTVTFYLVVLVLLSFQVSQLPHEQHLFPAFAFVPVSISRKQKGEKVDQETRNLIITISSFL